MVKRNGFSLIELVFAIVVVAIVMLSLPMMSDVTSKASARNLESDEAIFEAYVKAVETTDKKFADLLAGTTESESVGVSESKEAYKFDHNVSIKITSPASFGDVSNSPDIKKVDVIIKDKDGNVITKLYTYKFNM